MWNTPANDGKRTTAEDEPARPTKFSFADLFDINASSKDQEQEKSLRWTEARRFVQAAKVFLPDLTLETVYLLPRLALVDDKPVTASSSHKEDSKGRVPAATSAGGGGGGGGGGGAATAGIGLSSSASGANTKDIHSVDTDLDCFPSHSECARHLKSASWVAAKHPQARILYVSYLAQDGVGDDAGTAAGEEPVAGAAAAEDKAQKRVNPFDRASTYKGREAAAAEEARALQETRKAIYYFMVTKNFLLQHKEFAFVWVEGCCLPPYLRKQAAGAPFKNKGGPMGASKLAEQPVACMNEYIHPIALVISDAMLMIPPIIAPDRRRRVTSPPPPLPPAASTSSSSSPPQPASTLTPPLSPPLPQQPAPLSQHRHHVSSSSSLSDGWQSLRGIMESSFKSIGSGGGGAASATPPSPRSSANARTPPVAVPVPSSTAVAAAVVVEAPLPPLLKPHTDVKGLLMHPWKAAEMIVGMVAGLRTYMYFGYGGAHRYKLLPAPADTPPPPSPPPPGRRGGGGTAAPSATLNRSGLVSVGGFSRVGPPPAPAASSSATATTAPGSRSPNSYSVPTSTNVSKNSLSSSIGGSGSGAGNLNGTLDGNGNNGQPLQLQLQQLQQQASSGVMMTSEGHLLEASTPESSNGSRNGSSLNISTLESSADGEGGDIFFGGRVDDEDGSAGISGGGGAGGSSWGDHSVKEMEEAVEEVMVVMDLAPSLSGSTRSSFVGNGNGARRNTGSGGGGGGSSGGGNPAAPATASSSSLSISLSSTLPQAMVVESNSSSASSSSPSAVYHEITANWRTVIEPVKLLWRVHGDVSRFAAASGAIKQGVCSLTVTSSQAEEFFDCWELLRPLTMSPLAHVVGRLHTLTPVFSSPSLTNITPTTPTRGRKFSLSPSPPGANKNQPKLSPKQHKQQQQQQNQLSPPTSPPQHHQQQQQQQQRQADPDPIIVVYDDGHDDRETPISSAAKRAEDVRHQTAALNLVSFVMAFADGHVCPKRSDKQLKMLLAESLVIDDEGMDQVNAGGGGGVGVALHLDFWMKDLAPGDLEAMLAVLSKSSSKLSRASSLTTLKKLRKVTVGSSHSGGDGIGPFLSAAPNLVVLELEWEGIRSVSALATALSGHERLQKLNLTHNFIQEDGANLLATAMVMNKTLTELDLRENYIGPRGMEAIARAAAICPALKQLHCNENGIGDDGAIAITEALMRSQSLSVVGLDGNGISDVGATVLCAAIQNSVPLTSLSLKRNGFSSEVKMKLREAWTLRPNALAGVNVNAYGGIIGDDDEDSDDDDEDDGEEAAGIHGLKTVGQNGEEEDAYMRARRRSRLAREKPNGVIMSPVEKEFRRVVNWVLDGPDEDMEEGEEEEGAGGDGGGGGGGKDHAAEAAAAGEGGGLRRKLSAVMRGSLGSSISSSSHGSVEETTTRGLESA